MVWVDKVVWLVMLIRVVRLVRVVKVIELVKVNKLVWVRLQGTGQNCGLVSRNRPVSSGFYKGTLVSFLVLDGKKVLYLEV